MKRRWLYALGVACLTGCTLNSNRALPSGAAPAPGRAVLVYGVTVKPPQTGTQLQVDMVKYDIAAQKIDGNCFRFNRTEASTDAASDAVRYFAFDVAPGHYTLTPFLALDSAAQSTAFHVPAGATVYVGDFLYEVGTRLELVPALTANMTAIRQALPGLRGAITMAAPVPIERAYPFMCTP